MLFLGVGVDQGTQSNKSESIAKQSKYHKNVMVYIQSQKENN